MPLKNENQRYCESAGNRESAISTQALCAHGIPNLKTIHRVHGFMWDDGKVFPKLAFSS